MKVNVIVLENFMLLIWLHISKKWLFENLITSFPVFKVHEVDNKIPRRNIKSFLF